LLKVGVPKHEYAGVKLAPKQKPVPLPIEPIVLPPKEEDPKEKPGKELEPV